MAEINNCVLPDDLKYHVDNNIWVREEADGTLTLGMTDIAQSMAGSIIHCKAKKIGKSIKKNGSVATVESGKWVGPVKSPFSGEIIAINETVEKDPPMLNKSPYKEGWIVKLKPDNLQADMAELMDAAGATDGFKNYMEEKNFKECIHCEGFDQ